MPIAQRYSMDEVLDACRNYFQETGRRITFEYSLVAGVNDSDEDVYKRQAHFSASYPGGGTSRKRKERRPCLDPDL